MDHHTRLVFHLATGSGGQSGEVRDLATTLPVFHHNLDKKAKTF
jgi:hypothetical protein